MFCTLQLCRVPPNHVVSTYHMHVGFTQCAMRQRLQRVVTLCVQVPGRHPPDDRVHVGNVHMQHMWAHPTQLGCSYSIVVSFARVYRVGESGVWCGRVEICTAPAGVVLCWVGSLL